MASQPQYRVTLAGGTPACRVGSLPKVSETMIPLLTQGYTLWVRQTDDPATVVEFRRRDGVTTHTTTIHGNPTNDHPQWATRLLNIIP